MITFAGTVSLGGVVSRTVTLCVQVAVFPLPSVTVQTMLFAPSGRGVGALFATDATLQLSPVAGVPKSTLVAVQPELADTVMSAGQVIVGNCVSRTVTVCAHVAEFPLASCAVQVTVVTPLGYCVGASFAVVMLPPQLSLVVGVPSVTPVA